MKKNKAMLNVNFSKDGWFSKFYKFSTNLDKYDEITQNGCKIAWTTLFAILLLPLTWWNIILNLFEKNKYQRPPNLITKALFGLLSYIVYFLFIVLGYKFFVGGIDSNGEVLEPMVELINQTDLNLIWILLILPIMGIFILILLIGIAFSLVWIVIIMYESIQDYINDLNTEKYMEELSTEEDDIEIEHKRSTFRNFMLLLIKIKDKICPVVNWK